MMLLGIFGAFVGLVAMVAFSHQSNTGLTNKVHALQRKKQKLITQVQDMKQATRDLKEMEVALKQQTEEMFSDDELDLGADLITGVRKTKRQEKKVINSIVDVLLAEKLLDAEQLAKAEAYRQQSNSPYPIEEILSMLGYVNPDVIQRVKSKYPQLS